ncbi:MAG: type II secretion system F family protein [Aquificaceae bacterium]
MTEQVLGELLKKRLNIRQRASYYELSFVLLELSLLLEAGLSLIKALEVVASQTPKREIKEALLQIKELVERGESLYRSFSKTGIFPEFFLEMLKVAQRGENLQQILQIAGEYLRSVAETRSRVLTAIAYPSFVIVASLLAVLLVVKMVVPKISSVLQGLGKDLPLITKILLIFSQGLSYLLYLLLLLVVLYMLKDRIIGRERWDRFLLGVPLFGDVSLQYNLSRFAGSLLMALSSGLPITRAISLSLGSISNSFLRTSLSGIELEVSKGKSLSSALRERAVLPETFINLLAIGERSGELEKSLRMLRDMYERQVQNTIAFWLRFVEPIAMLLVGLLVAFIVLSVVLPLSEISAGKVR